MTVKLVNDKEKQIIYRLHTVEGDTKAALSRLYGVSERTIRRIIKEVADDTKAPETIGDLIKQDQVESEIDQYSEDHYDYDDYVNESEYDDLVEDEVAEYQFIATKDSISITKIVGDNAHTEVVAKDHENYTKAYQIIAAGMGSDESLTEAFLLISKKEALRVVSSGRVVLDTNSHKLVVDGEVVLPYSLYNKMVQTYTEGKDITKLIHFAEHLSDNISNSIVNRLYDFISHNSVEITDDGMIVCYKKVDHNFKDCYTHTFDNSVGKTVQVRRNQVDERMEQTCSYGLHVCAAHYLPSYGSASSNKVVKVLLDPADVVAIPRDYHDSKVRCCKYTVLEDVSEQYYQGLIK